MRFLIIAILFGSTSLPGAENLGRFSGLLFNGPSQSQDIHINGGSLVNCEETSNSTYLISKCEVVDASITVGSGKADSYTFSKATMLVPIGSGRRHYYYHGSREIKIGDQTIRHLVKVTFSQEDANLGRVSGYLELTEANVKSWFDAVAE